MSPSRLRLAFAGTPMFAVPSLQALMASKHEVVTVFTQPDRPAGRGRKLTACPVKQCALGYDLPVQQPQHFRQPELQAELEAMELDALIVVAYGHLIPAAILATPRLGCINVHASLLPRWRGAAPINAAILAGDHETGITIMQMAAGLDTGPMLNQASIPIDAHDTCARLHDKLAELGAQTLVQTLPLLAAGNIQAQPQDDSLATYAHKIEKQHARINWSQSAVEIDRHIRAYNPWPVCFTQLDNQTLRIWQAELSSVVADALPGDIVSADKHGIVVSTGEGCLRITRLQMPNKPAHDCADIMNAYADLFQPGVRLL